MDKRFVFATKHALWPWTQFVAATERHTSTNVFFKLMPASNDEALLCYSEERAVSCRGYYLSPFLSFF